MHLADQRAWARMAGTALLLYCGWLMLSPFLPAISWAFALAVVGTPLSRRLMSAGVNRSLAALLVVVLALLIVFAPAVFVVRSVADDVRGMVDQVSGDGLRGSLDQNALAGPILRWLEARLDLKQAIGDALKNAGGWAVAALRNSLLALTQVAIAMFVLFYFVRDGQLIVGRLRTLLPLDDVEADLVLSRIADTLRVALGGRAVTAAVQGTLGGLMFYWLELPAPAFWGSVMFAASLFPFIGSFLVWIPAAVGFATQGNWKNALILTIWGVAVVNPVDNVLGPMLVGTALRLHTLLVFFSILGGIAAFHGAGIVVGPALVATVAALLEVRAARAANAG